MTVADVLIVGAGPAGASTAFMLARSGIDVLMLDRAHFPRDKPCSEYLSPEASRVLDDMGALPLIERAHPAELAGMKVRAPNGQWIHGDFAGAHGFRGFRDHGLAIRRHILDEILVQRARAAGARVVEGLRATDLLFDSRGRVEGVRALDANGRVTELGARIVVGADGLRSVVSRRLGLARTARFPRRIALVTHYRGVAGVGDYGEMHTRDGEYIGIAAVDNGFINVALVIPTSRARELSRDRTAFLEARIAASRHLAARFLGAERVSPVVATGPFASRARRAWAPGAALVGDAADFFDPFTGEGIYAALRGGELLSGALTDALGARTAREANVALAAYDEARVREFRGKWMVERLVGLAVAFPPLLNRAATVLARHKDMADLLIGVTGDFVPAREVLRPSYLLSLLFSGPLLDSSRGHERNIEPLAGSRPTLAPREP